MKISAIKGSRKRKQKNESLLKIANIKKTRTKRKMKMTSVLVHKGIQKAERLQNKSGLFPDFTVAKSKEEKIFYDKYNMSNLVVNV